MSDESIFAAALGKAPGAERRAFLDGACGSDDALRRRIERLLEADGRTAGILERGPDAGPTDALGEDGPPLLPERVFAGRFKLRQKLGEGGMGEVWVADQSEPVQRRVAIKVVRPGLDSERMLARFDQEKRTLVPGGCGQDRPRRGDGDGASDPQIPGRCQTYGVRHGAEP